MQSRRSHLNHPSESTSVATAASSNEDFGTKRTIVVLVIIVGCFAVVWPNVFYPMLVGNSAPQPKKTVGCCDVISELDVDTIKIMSELCGTIIEHPEGAVLSPREIVSQCKKAVIDKCGIDLSAALYDRVSLGHSTKQILEEVRSLNGSLCLKYYFGVAPWKLGVPHRVNLNLDPANNIKQERPSTVNPVKIHPALKERGRAIYGAHEVTTEARRKRPPPIIVEGRPGPIPGRRPTIGMPGEVAPSKISNYGLMGVLMPIYTIAFIIFFTYIVKQIVYKKKPINYVGSPLYPPCDSDEQFEEQVFHANPQYFNRPNKDTSKIVVNAVAALLEEVNQAVEEHKNKLPSDSSNEQNAVKINGVLPKDEEQSSVTVLGMETRASCENGGKWSRPDSPVFHSPEVPIEHSPSPQQIFLEGSLPPQSQILVADSATEAQTDADDNSSVILAGKMTLSVISLDSEPGNEEGSSIVPKNEGSDEEGKTSSSNISDEFEKIYATDVEDHINNIIEEAENAVLAEKTRDDLGPIPSKTTPFSDILDEMRKEFNLVEDLLQSSSGSEGKSSESQLAEDLLDLDEPFIKTGNSIEETDEDATLTTQENVSGNLKFPFIPDQPPSEEIPDTNGSEEISVCQKAVEHDEDHSAQVLLDDVEEGVKETRSGDDPNGNLDNETTSSNEKHANEERKELDDTKFCDKMENEDLMREREATIEGSGLRSTVERENNIEKRTQNDPADPEERPDTLSEEDPENIVEI